MTLKLSKQYLNMTDRIHNTNTTEPLPLIIEAQAEEIDGKRKGNLCNLEH
ncbi:MAG: hypothetical protein CM15mV150_250 [Caudoviricetes sp.]|nr:MAG: hypothetical protein CM15mV150_250 [Caudoviricetes sp.]